MAQEYPLEWTQFTSSGYLYDVQSDNNSHNLPVTEFTELLQNNARSNLARQIQTRVQEQAKLNKKVQDGKTSITYQTQISFSTDVDMRLITTRYAYDSKTSLGYAIAYIEKSQAREYYINESTVLLEKAKSSIEMSTSYMEKEFREKAQSELDKAEDYLKKSDKIIFLLNVFELPHSDLLRIQQQILNTNKTVQELKLNFQGKTGTITYDEGIYTGEIYNGVPHGYGEFVKESADVDWCFSGKWETAKAFKIIYKGNWMNGVMEGRGELLGYMYRPLKDGSLQLTFTFDGIWKSGRYGEGLYEDGQMRYEGAFFNGRPNGHGRMTDRHRRDIIEGDFLDGELNGMGTYTNDKKGDRYVGEFRSGLWNGKGVYYYPDGTEHNGYFFNNCPSGPATIKYKNGDTYSGNCLRIQKDNKWSYVKDGEWVYVYAKERKERVNRKSYKNIKSFKCTYHKGVCTSSYSYYDKNGVFLFSVFSSPIE